MRLDPRRWHPIVVSPLEPQSEPSGLGRLNAQLGWRWPTTGLLDVFKEADLRVGFTAAFATATSREAIDRDEVRRRLLLCLYGLGIKAELKRLAVGQHGFSYKELLQHGGRLVGMRRWVGRRAPPSPPQAIPTRPWRSPSRRVRRGREAQPAPATVRRRYAVHTAEWRNRTAAPQSGGLSSM